MSDVQTSEPSSRSFDPGMTLRQLRDETIVLALPALYILGLILVASVGQFRDPLQAGLPGAFLFLLPIGVWALRKLNYLASAWSLVIGCLTVDLLIVAWGHMYIAGYLLILPVGLAALFISVAGGALTAMACSFLLLYAPVTFLAADGSLQVITLIAMWGTVGLIWLTSRPLLTAMQWFWSSYEQNRALLDEARDSQMRLAQALEDLAAANLQLTRLNQLAQGLRLTAEEARRAKEQFVANVSHELRTPLNMIIGFSEMIVQAPETYGSSIPPALLADLNVILRNSQHLSSLVDDVLDLSQIEAEQMALTKEHVALDEIVEAATIAVRPLFDSKGLYLETEIPQDLPPVFCDRTRIRQVVLNLLSNAGRFTASGGVRIHAWQERNDIVVSVADTGPGIAAEDQSKLFQPFQQLDGSLRRGHGGSGLGLSISKSFVELHGGKMWLESEKGIGTTFFFLLPIDPPIPIEGGASRWLTHDWEYKERTRPSRAPVAAVRSRFVVLETGNSLRRLLSRYWDGVEIMPVRDVVEAKRELAHMPAQALLVNELPGSTAFQRLTEAATLPYGIPAIICSVPGADEAAVTLGVSDYLVKPISRDTLLATLERLELRGKTVLIVDDEPDAQRLFRRMLSSSGRGYRVLRADSGRQALSILHTQCPDVILLDLVMPDMSGIQLLQAKNQDPALRNIPVVLISARDPMGQPIVSDSVTVTRGGGLSMQQVLACIEALSGILSAAD